MFKIVSISQISYLQQHSRHGLYAVMDKWINKEYDKQRNLFAFCIFTHCMFFLCHTTKLFRIILQFSFVVNFFFI